jgi:hypothetical protein
MTQVEDGVKISGQSSKVTVCRTVCTNRKSSFLPIGNKNPTAIDTDRNSIDIGLYVVSMADFVGDDRIRRLRQKNLRQLD